MISADEFEKLSGIIKNNNNFVITTHVNPDGDGLGSELAMLRLLEKLGKNAIIINHSSTPSFYTFLDPDGTKIHRYNSTYDEQIKSCDVIIILDISVIDRLGRLKDAVSNTSGLSVCIDHHVSNSRWSEMNLVDDTASASGEIVFDLINHMEVEIDKDIALYLYVAILTDTGSFRFSSTTPRTHYVCAKLLEHGLNVRKIFGEVYESYSWERMLLFSKALSTIRKVAGGRASSIYITNDMMKSVNAKREDIEGFVEYMTTISDVEVAALFLEMPDGAVKVSLRSKEKQNVNELASKFGGGGHKNASGIYLENYKLEKAVEEVLAEIEKIL